MYNYTGAAMPWLNVTKVHIYKSYQVRELLSLQSMVNGNDFGDRPLLKS